MLQELARDESSGDTKLGVRTIVALVAGAAFLLACIFVRLMDYGLQRDEQLYAPPAFLLGHLHLYTDFFYNHVPISAWLFRAAYVVTGGEHLLFAARLGVFGGWLVLAAAALLITYRITRSLPATAFIALGLLTNDLLLSIAGMTATNNFLPLPFAYLGLGLFVLGVTGGRGARPLLVAAAGVCLSLAAGVKASALAFIPAVAVASFLVPAAMPLPSRLLRVALPLAVGGIVGALPVLVFLATHTDLFLAHVVGFHTGPQVGYWKVASSAIDAPAISLADKARLAYLTWATGANAILLFLLVFLVAVQGASGPAPPSPAARADNGVVIAIAATLVIAAVLSFVPTPAFPQYFVPPLAPEALLLALLFARLEPTWRKAAERVLLCGAIILLVINLPRLTQHLAHSVRPGSWTVMQVHDKGREIARLMADAGLSGKVATLAPVYVLEAHLDVYPELATGQFIYRSMPYASADLGRHYRTTSPSEIETLLAADPPAAFLVGFAPPLEEPMLRFARAHGYVEVDGFSIEDTDGRAVLYLRPVVPRS